MLNNCGIGNANGLAAGGRAWKRLAQALLFIPLAASMARPDSLTLVTSQPAQNANDSISWSQLGQDGTNLGSTFAVQSAQGLSANVAAAGTRAVVAVVCSASPCSWTGSGFTAKDTLLWTPDTANGGTGPVTLTFANGVAGAGALIQPDAPGQFTAQLEAFNGADSLGTFTVPSDTEGDAVYIGVNDQTGPNITSVVFSITSCASICSDFAVDSVAIDNASPSSGAAVSLSSANLTFGSVPIGTTSAAQSVTLKNTGTGTLTISAIIPNGDFAQTNTCGTSVKAGASCSISITFTPTATGLRTGAVTITDNASNSSQVINLSGTGIGPAVTLSASSLTFAAQPLGTTSKAQSATLKNVGTGVLVISGITITGNFAQTNTCGVTLAAGASCTISVTFSPVGTGIQTGVVTILDDSSNGPQTINLTGTGTNVELSPASLIFPATPLEITTSAQIVTVINVGTIPLNISNVALGGADPGDFNYTSGCSGPLAAGASCTISVVFHPLANGKRTASLSITDTGYGSPQVVGLTGTGTGSIPVVSLSPSSLTFGTQAIGTISAAKPVTLQNVGTSTLIIAGITAAGNFAQTNNCGTTLAAGASCTISVTFDPTATGTLTGAIQIVDNAGPAQSVGLTGTGTNLELGPTSLSFPSTALGHVSAAETVTLTNVGAGPLNVTNVSLAGADPGDFSETNGCVGPLAVGASCTISVIFHPRADGARSAFLSIADTGFASPQSIPLSGTGTGSFPTVTLSSTSLVFGIEPIGTSSAAQPVTLQNTSASTPLTVVSISTNGSFTQTNNCGSSLAAGASCTIDVTFDPTATGTNTGVLMILDNTSTAQESVSLSGTGTNVELSTTSLVFPAVTVGQQSSPEDVTFTNVGSTSVSVSGIAIEGTDPPDFSQTNKCGNVQPGATCTIAVVFQPKATGTRTAVLVINDNGVGSPQSVSLSGTGQ